MFWHTIDFQGWPGQTKEVFFNQANNVTMCCKEKCLFKIENTCIKKLKCELRCDLTFTIKTNISIVPETFDVASSSYCCYFYFSFDISYFYFLYNNNNNINYFCQSKYCPCSDMTCLFVIPLILFLALSPKIDFTLIW